MSRRIRLGAAAFGLALTGFVAASSSPSGAGVKIPALDPQLCGKVVSTGFHNPPDTIILQNAIQPVYFSPTVISPTVQCNPVSLTYGTKSHHLTTWVRNPKVHLMCWSLTYTWKPYIVQIHNWFGNATMSTGSPSSVCLPTWVSTTGPVQKTLPAPPGVDYFACYPLTAIAGDPSFKVPPLVQEQSVPHTTPIPVRVRVVTQLCVPTTFIDNNQQNNPQTSNDPSLTCWTASVKLTPPKKYFELNEFGAGSSKPSATSSLCIRSNVVLQGPG